MPTVRLPAPFVSYACQRTLVCCQHPLRAPCDHEDEARIAPILASSAAGRAHLAIFTSGFESSGETRVFKHVGDRCVHLVAPTPDEPAVEPGCSLHFIGGVDALAPACRNYPRWVTRLPDPPPGDAARSADGALVEALFLPACPTVARLLVQDPRPFTFVELPLEDWPYPPTRETSAAELEAVAELRAGWWRVLRERRDDTEHLIAVLSALHDDPLDPPPRISVGGAPSAALLAGQRSVDIGFVHDALERIPARGAHYASVHWDLWRDLTCEITPRQLHDALDIAPGLVTAFVDHLIPYAGVHDQRPVDRWLRVAVRRALAVARMVDSLMARTPFPIDVLFADAISGAMHIDARDTRVVSQPP